MRNPPHALLVLLLLPAAGCGGDLSTITGDLLEGDGATDVWVLGGEARSAVAEGAFEMADVEGDTVYLRFSRGEDEVGRMDILGLPRGGRLRLQRVWMDDGVAFPSAVEVEGAEVVTVNGLRWGSPDRVPRDIEEPATVLSVGRAGDALLLRPTRETLPDLRVAVTPGTLVTNVDGEPVSLDELAFGDSLTVKGAREEGFVVATELVLPRRRTAQAAEEREEAPAAAAEPEAREEKSREEKRPPKRRGSLGRGRVGR